MYKIQNPRTAHRTARAQRLMNIADNYARAQSGADWEGYTSQESEDDAKAEAERARAKLWGAIWADVHRPIKSRKRRVRK